MGYFSSEPLPLVNLLVILACVLLILLCRLKTKDRRDLTNAQSIPDAEGYVTFSTKVAGKAQMVRIKDRRRRKHHGYGRSNKVKYS